MPTGIDIAYFTADVAVSAVNRSGFETIVTRNTNLSEDDLSVVIGGIVFGWLVSEALKPWTHAAVDQAASKLATIRENYRTKKQQA